MLGSFNKYNDELNSFSKRLYLISFNTTKIITLYKKLVYIKKTS